MDNQKKTVWIWVGVIVAIILVALFFFLFLHFPGGLGSRASTPTAASSTSAGVAVPNEDSKNVAAGVAVPQQQVAVEPGSTASLRSFAITVTGNDYTPNTVIVNQGDIVNLEITAADANYGFTQPDYGLNASIVKGKTQQIQFQALQSGNFEFYCGSCGGPAKGPVGHIIVNAL